MITKEKTLRDGSKIVIRTMTTDDVDNSLDFFAGLPPDDRKYLRYDVTQRELVEQRIRDIDTGRVVRLIAISDGNIVADGALEIAGHGWGDGVAEIRLIVSRPFQRLGLGSILARELYFLAVQHKVDRIVARVMQPQEGGLRIMHRLGFREQYVIPEHVRDQDGVWQDLVIMRCNLEDIWNQMETLFEQSDLRWHR